MNEISIERATLWDLLIDPSYLVIHLPRFALFLIISIPLLIYCDKKVNSVRCTFATVFLMVCTTVFGIVGIYYFVTASIYPGYRFPIPVWFYPLTLSILIFSAGMFTVGFKKDYRRNTRPLVVCRTLIFLITSAFSIIAISTPHKINMQIVAWEQKQQNQRFDPIVKTPVDKVAAQGTQGHP